MTWTELFSHAVTALIFFGFGAIWARKSDRWTDGVK